MEIDEQLITIIGAGLITALSINFLIVIHLLNQYQLYSDSTPVERRPYVYATYALIGVIWLGIIVLAILGATLLYNFKLFGYVLFLSGIYILSLALSVTVIAAKTFRGSLSSM